MSFIPSNQPQGHVQCVAMKIHEPNYSVLPKTSNEEYKQRQQNLFENNTSAFVDRLFKTKGAHKEGVKMFQSKFELDIRDLIAPEATPFRQHVPRKFVGRGDYFSERETLKCDIQYKDQTANALSQAKDYFDNFSTQKNIPAGKLSKGYHPLPLQQTPQIQGFRNLGSYSPEPSAEIHRIRQSDIVPPWIALAPNRSLKEIMHKPNPATRSTVGECFNYNDGYTVPANTRMPKCGIERLQQGGDLTENPYQTSVPRHKRLIAGQFSHTPISPPGSSFVKREETTNMFFQSELPRRANTSMLP